MTLSLSRMPRTKRPNGSGYMPANAQVQNAASSRVYVFASDDIAEDEVSVFDPGTEAVTLRPRGSAAQLQQTTTEERQDEKEKFLEYDIQEHDTLLSLSLKFCCPVAELKRVNKLVREQDFFALRILKIPARHHGILSELVEKQKHEAQLAGRVEYTDDVDTRPGLTTDEEYASEAEGLVNSAVHKAMFLHHPGGPQAKKAQGFIQRMDEDLKRIQRTAPDRSRLGSLSEVTQHLRCKRITPLKPTTDGATCGWRWWYIVVVMVCIAILLPLLLIIGFEKTKSSPSSP